MSEIPRELVTLRDLVRWGASRFAEAGLWYGHGTDNALDEALALVLHGLHLGHDLPESYLDSRITEEERARVIGLLRRRVDERIPAAYLTGRAWFAGLEFEVDRRVLLPRSPIAELIEAGFQPWLGDREPRRVVDLCTGSGCIAIACALAFPQARVDATDVSADALAVAHRNRERYGLERRLELVQGDLFAGLDGRRYDLIVSNPPYVDAEELAAMPDEYRHEPEIGLAAGADGLDIVRRILSEAPERLSATGIMVVEVGASAPALQDAYPEVPFCWVEFENGGEGVFVLTGEQVQAHKTTFTGQRD